MIIRIARQFGQCVRARREELGWSQDDLASRAGVSRSTVYRLEAGTTTSLYPAKLLSVLDALGLEVSVELKDEDKEAHEGANVGDDADDEKPSSMLTEVVVEDVEDEPQFTLDDLLAMGDAYRDYADELKRRDAEAALDGGEP